METRPRVIRAELMECLTSIDHLISEVNLMARNLGIEPSKIRDTTGALMLTPLVVSKVQALNGLILLNGKENH